MTGIEPGRPADEKLTPEPSLSSPQNGATPASLAATDASLKPEPPAAEPATSATDVALGEESEAARKPILIGSQRDPAAYRARPKRDWTPVDGDDHSKTDVEGGQPTRKHGKGNRGSYGKGQVGTEGGNRQRHDGGGGPRAQHEPSPDQSKTLALPPAPVKPVAVQPATVPPNEGPSGEAKPLTFASDRSDGSVGSVGLSPPPGADSANLDAHSLPPPEPLFPEPVLRESLADDDAAPVLPGRRQKLTAKMEAELDRAMAGLSLDDLMTGGESSGQQEILEPESRHRGRVAAVRRDEIFVELGGRQQGCLSGRMMEALPQPGDEIEVVVQRFNAEEGLYDLTLPGASVDLGNWDEVHEGMLVDVQVTGHNTGGLECETSHVRGFIPVSQISLYRVEDLAQFVGQRFACLITEANPARKNLVLSRRAVLEREQEEKKAAFLEALAPGQVYEGTVRKLMDFGAFVELGNGVDGLLHISQLSWGRIKHPSEVLQEGQQVRVRVEKFDRETGRIGLSYREMIENPWTTAAGKYPHNAIVRGKVTRLMEFGAFVEVEPGIEGLIHVSELSHKRIWRASDVVKEGEEVEVLVLSVNPEAQRMSLSIKGLSKPEPTKKEKEEAQEAEVPVATTKPGRPSNVPLKGGLGKTAGGESLGLNW